MDRHHPARRRGHHAHLRLGRAFDMTRSQTKQPLPPLVRIDHVLTGPGVAVTTIRSDVGLGSDHRDLLATVAVRRK
jgi:endonuclease/exonuclease/phosphatase family metal-dependent hydrolase